MPQLNPRPWLAIYFFAWLMFLAFLPFKVSDHSFPEEYTDAATYISQPENWLWPWL
uniref:ATP synthase complex subunit 8 n=1 Tax=Chaetodontoplus poliourus TaxID=2599946 RepID=A0A5B8HNE7_9TELE|nr:ATP synthase F0 subunit 8 [Chaetodontoplus poliourus]QDX14954.1 ATP synthase F0 subunit 8 [Chaetodontoplus poliourus]